MRHVRFVTDFYLAEVHAGIVDYAYYSDNAELNAAMRFLRGHFHEPLTLNMVAQVALISSRTLHVIGNIRMELSQSQIPINKHIGKPHYETTEKSRTAPARVVRRPVNHHPVSQPGGARRNP